MKPIYIDEEKIYINGKPEKIMSGAMHYFRIVPEYWYDRLLKLKEQGCNCVETYICWNLHEKREGEFDFSGALDFCKFLEIAKSLGLYAIVRPGPYICSEWDFGGFPWWLLKYSDIELRCSQPLYLEKITPYLEKVCELLKEHLITRGGNVIFVQLENEYGSYGNDKNYLKWLKAFYEQRGIDCPLITSDGETEFLLKNGTLPDVFASVNYRWDSVRCINSLKKYHGGQPGAVLELWNGKAQHWGEPIVRRDIKEVADSVETALDNAELVNLYMFHGGTSFGFMNGSLDFGENLIVQMTSYDVDAPLDEYGRRTPKYYAEQQVILRKLGKEKQNTATDTVLKNFGSAKYIGESLLNSSLVRKTESPTVLTMEQCDQGYGYIIYRTRVFIGEKGAKILFPEVHDIAQIYVNGKHTKTLYRNGERELLIENKGEAVIEIVVENMGRVNYGTRICDRKGLTHDLEIFDIEYNVHSKIFGFEIFSLELEKLPSKFDDKAEINAPAFYKYEIDIEKAEDTVLALEGFSRGFAFINGINLGRHWDIENSQNRLFIPAPFLKEGKNEIIVFDILAKDGAKRVELIEN